MQSVTIPLQARNLPAEIQRPETDFKIDYQTRRDDQDREVVCKVALPAERTFKRSVTPPLQARDRLEGHKRLMTEFKIDYQTRRDNKGHEIVYKVYLPSTYKGWVIMAEKKDAASPAIEELVPDSPVGHIRLRYFATV